MSGVPFCYWLAGALTKERSLNPTATGTGDSEVAYHDRAHSDLPS
jgi:hypothetical protein